MGPVVPTRDTACMLDMLQPASSSFLFMLDHHGYYLLVQPPRSALCAAHLFISSATCYYSILVQQTLNVHYSSEYVEYVELVNFHG